MSERELRTAIAHRLEGLNADELEVVGAFVARMWRGRESYGPLDLDSDQRDFSHEAEEEALDLAAYGILRGLRRARRGGQ